MSEGTPSMTTLETAATKKVLLSMREATDIITNNNALMILFLIFGLAFFVICSLQMSLTNKAEECVDDKGLTNTGYIFNSFGIVIGLIIIVLTSISIDAYNKFGVANRLSTLTKMFKIN